MATSKTAAGTAAAPEGGAPVAILPGAPTLPEIVFFDVETSVPQREGQRYALLEFGAILVCPRKLVEITSYATLIRPADPASAVSAASMRCNGITRDAVSRAPPFRDVADAVYDILNGRIWAGHNIARFDSARVGEAFAEIGQPPPEPKGMIDTLDLLSQCFGRRAGDMKMATLANYFGLGKQRHRSLDDVRMNLEILKYCATVLFLEESLPEVLTVENLVEHAKTRNQANAADSPDLPKPEAKSSPDSSKWQQTVSQVDSKMPEGGNPGTSDLSTSRESVKLASNIKEMKLDTTMHMDTSSGGYSGFLEPDDVSTECIKISIAPLHRFWWRSSIQHRDCPLQLFCAGLKIQFGVSTKFIDNAGRPKLSIVVEIPENLGKVLEFCDDLARRLYQESGSNSEWRPLIKRYICFNRPTVHLNFASSNDAIYSTDICQKEPSGNIQKLAFSNAHTRELKTLFVQGSMAPVIWEYRSA